MGENGGSGGGGTRSGDSGTRHDERIFVSVRLRPLNGREIVTSDVSDWECIGQNTIAYKNGSLGVPERSMYPSAYTFDRVFGYDCSTRQVYQDGAKDVVLSVVGGINASIFAYGQTSSGKTFTMTGITEYTLADIYDYVQKHPERDFHLKFSAMEIYNESVRDLLSSDGYPLRLLDDPERGTIVENLTDESIRDWDHMMELLSICEAQRQSGETSLNETSSRSHQIIRLTIESTPSNYLGRDSATTLVSTVNFVDLAGSERASQSLTAGTRLKEGCHINRSLLTLGTVIRKLSKGRSGHIPFRDSKLTRILQSSLGGNSRTAIICTMSPARSHVEQSRNTLLFASCAKEVSTNAQVNTVISDKALVKHLQRELDRLENELRTPGSNRITSDTTAALLREKDHQLEKMQKKVDELTAERDDARSHVQDLLRVVESNGSSLMRLDSDDNYPNIRVQMTPDVETYMIPETSTVVDTRHSFDGSIRTVGSSRYSPRRSESSFEENYIRVTEFEVEPQPDHTPLRPMVRIAQSETESCLDWDEVDDKSNATPQVLCKVVRCIETDDSVHNAESYCSSPDVKARVPNQQMFHDDQSENENDNEVASSKPEYMSSRITQSPNEETETETRLNEEKKVKKTEAPVTDEGLQSFPHDKEEVSQSFKLQKSRSWNEGNTPPNGYEKYYTGRPVGFPTKPSTFNNGVESENGSVSSKRNIKEEKKNGDEDDLSFTSATKEPNETQITQHNEKIEDSQITTTKRLKSVKSIGLDPIEDCDRSESWSIEFKRLQKEIIQLWHACNVSLVHRTYFFLLFNGEPTDSVYMEVEHKRLAFLKDMFTHVNVAIDDGRTVTRSSAEKSLRREREMLTKQMQKKLTEQEREGLFLRWGIALNTKYRRIQLANKLWTRIDDVDHVADSAMVVAKLVGLLTDPGHAPKAMFGLNFAPQSSKKSYSFKRSLIPHLKDR
ncbi:hypothetical protein LXL04_013811 [Taraxacum kok-saghyz]